jgi:hypothetical protein
MTEFSEQADAVRHCHLDKRVFDIATKLIIRPDTVGAVVELADAGRNILTNAVEHQIIAIGALSTAKRVGQYAQTIGRKNR